MSCIFQNEERTYGVQGWIVQFYFRYFLITIMAPSKYILHFLLKIFIFLNGILKFLMEYWIWLIQDMKYFKWIYNFKSTFLYYYWLVLCFWPLYKLLKSYSEWSCIYSFSKVAIFLTKLIWKVEVVWHILKWMDNLFFNEFSVISFCRRIPRTF